MNPYNTENIIILRSVFKNVLKEYHIQPCKNPQTGRYPDCVRKVDSNGDMILSEKDKNEGAIVIPEDRVFIIKDGVTFNLDDPYSKAEWEAIEHCFLIAPSRTAKDKNGNLLIDGTDNRHTKNYSTLQSARYGLAELYIERQGEETNKRVSKRKLKNQAENFVFGDNQEGLILKAKLLGRDMRYQPLADIQDYLIEIAERDPNKIITLYTGEDMHLRLLLVDALQKKTIIIKNKLYIYSDNVVLGASDEAVVTWMKQSQNSKVLELIKRDTYPEIYEVKNPETAAFIEEKKKSAASKQE